jgi:SagB-type dehydrogenase family enzyme
MLNLILILLSMGYQIHTKEVSSMIIELPSPSTKGKVSVEEAISKRRSIRNFKENDLSLNEISQILWSAQGITKKTSYLNLRAAPSAGAIYPITVFLIKKDGVFEYLVEKHSIKLISQKDIREKIAEASFNQNFISKAPISLILCANYSKITQKYGKRGIRYADIEVGHIAENIHLQAVSLELGSVPVGAFDDEKISEILSLPKDLKPVYIIPIGRY